MFPSAAPPHTSAGRASRARSPLSTRWIVARRAPSGAVAGAPVAWPSPTPTEVRPFAGQRLAQSTQANGTVVNGRCCCAALRVWAMAKPPGRATRAAAAAASAFVLRPSSWGRLPTRGRHGEGRPPRACMCRAIAALLACAELPTACLATEIDSANTVTPRPRQREMSRAPWPCVCAAATTG